MPPGRPLADLGLCTVVDWLYHCYSAGALGVADNGAWAPPVEFDSLKIARPLGQGGMGYVYLGHDTVLDRPVALKFAKEEQASEAVRFLTEARALARLSHPNVVGVFRVGDLQGRPFLVYEFVEGKSLDRMEAPLPWRRALAIATSVANGLTAAHERGVLHRDIKPANVMLAKDGVVKLIDFGLAQFEGAGTPHATEVAGTPQFMAPELLRGEPASAQSDIYSFGVLLYWLCAGRLPTQATTVPVVRDEAIADRPLPPLPAGIPSELMAIIARCRHPNPRDRFRSAAELYGQLETIARAPRVRQPLVEPGTRVSELRLIHEGDRFIVFRGLWSGRPAIVKSVRPERADTRSDELLRREYALLDELDVPGVVKPLAFEKKDEHSALVLEDVGPLSLADSIRGLRLDVDTFLDLAVRMARIVAEVHRRHIIHGDLCPANFVLGDNGQVTLIDFGQATTVIGVAQAPGSVEATLPYLAPEQTGRMNRAADQRADLYSLGATFYEMLVGTPPFPFADPLEVVHAHLAMIPTAPAAVSAAVPALVSELVLKLLAKMPEWRYQSAEALHADLEEAQRQWRDTRAIASFDLGRLDRRELQLPAKLYGREPELARLAAALADTVAGANQLLVIKGPSGIGKTTLVNHLQDQAKTPGTFAAAKCDVVAGDVPLAPFVQALRGLTRELLELPETVLPPLRQRIRDAVSPLGGFLIDLVPELEQVVGAQPPAPPGAIELPNRAERVLLALLRALTGPARPLTFLIDDAQWLDPASLQLLGALVSQPDIHHLLIIFTWRSEEVGPEHPVAQAVQSLRQRGAHVAELEIGPLDDGAVEAILAETLGCSPERAQPLGQIVLRKTAGNPYFLFRFLRSLQQSGLLTFDVGLDRWTWDARRIAEEPSPEAIVDLLVAAIRRLPESAQLALQVAACIGNQFDVALLGHVLGQDKEALLLALAVAGRELLVVPVAAAAAPAWRFVHDRVQQAAHSLLSDEREKALHLAIGERLIELATDSTPVDTLFRAVDHFNRAAELLATEEARLQLIELNEKAAQRAKSATAYAAALAYLRHGIALLPADAWSSRHDLAFRLYRDAIELTTIAANSCEAERLADMAFAQTLSRLESAMLCDTLAERFRLGDIARSLHWGEVGLRLFGFELPREECELEPAIASTRSAIEELLKGRTPEQLLDAPVSLDLELSVLQKLALGVHVGKMVRSENRSATLVALWAVRSALAQGHTARSDFAYAVFGRVLAAEGDYARAHAFGRLGVELARRLGDQVAETMATALFSINVSHWVAPLRVSAQLLQANIARALATGTVEWALYCHAHLVWTHWALGTRLHRLVEIREEAVVFARKLDSGVMLETLIASRQAERCLKGWTARHNCFDDVDFSETSLLHSSNQYAFKMFATLRLQVSYLLRDWAVATDFVQRLEARPSPEIPSVPHFEFVMYAALTLAATAEQDGAQISPARMSRIIACERMLQSWASSCPDTFRHKSALVTAERARIEGRDGDAERLYAVAIASATREGFVQDQAIAEECLGRHYLARGQRHLAAEHLNAAVDAFARWGASAKVTLLDLELAALELPVHRVAKTPVTPSRHESDLDVLTLLRAAETLSGEVVLERLLAKMMHICVEAAGAQRAVLVLEQDSQPVVRALAAASSEIALMQVPLAAQPELPLALIERVRQRGAIVALGNAAEEGDFVSDPDIARRSVKSVLSVPIRRGERLVGVLYFENNLASDVFRPERIRLFELLSTEIAISLENSLLFEERMRAEATARFLADSSAILAESLDYDVTLAKMARLAVPFLADACTIDVVENGRVRRVAGVHINPTRQWALDELAQRYPANESSTTAGRVLRTGEPILLATITDEALAKNARDPDHLRLVRAIGACSLIAVPLTVRGRIAGALTLTSTQPTRRYGQADLTIAQDLARRAAFALDNAILYRESQAAGQKRHVAPSRPEPPPPALTPDVVRVATSEGLAERFVVPAVIRLRLTQPSLEVALRTGLTLESLQRGEADVGLWLAEAPHPELVAQPLGRLTHRLYAARAYVEQHGLPEVSLHGYDVVTCAEDDLAEPSAAFAGADATGAKIVMQANSRRVLMSAVAEGVGIAALPSYLAETDTRLVQVLPQFEQSYPLYLICQRDRIATPQLRAVCDAITSQARRQTS
jgi:predicted ATPase/serine/threonine protein kinase/GAF domain-containing protein